MVSKKEVIQQLKKIGFKHNGWGRSEIGELPHIILPDEEIYECVNGIYEGGFALIVATDIRVLLIDKKPLSYLTVEDMRFDMISEMDYSHRLWGAEISISSGEKNLRFRSYNKAKLRKLIGHVQHCMAATKKKQATHQDSQVSHLEQINRQLQAYLVAQHQYQLQLQQMNTGTQPNQKVELPPPPKPSHELADYLYAYSLMNEHNKSVGDTQVQQPKEPASPEQSLPLNPIEELPTSNNQMEDIYAEGFREVIGDQASKPTQSTGESLPHRTARSFRPDIISKINVQRSLDINPLHIAYSKLPMVLRHRKFARPSLPPNPAAGVDAAPSQA